MTLTAKDISALYEQHADIVLRFCMRRTLDAQVSIDIVGETFAVAFEKRKRFRGTTVEQSRSWLTGIALNLLNDYFRDGAIERRAMARLGVERVEIDEVEIERIDQLAESSSLRRAVAGALDDLSAESKQAIQLRVVDELPYAEVAARLDVTEQVARARVSRGLRKLRSTLEMQTGSEVMENV